MVLRRAELARTNNFDLLGDAGFEALRTELATDFPYLTLADLNAIIKLGIKGKLDTAKTRPLNFTRVYQWVEQRAACTLGYWQQRYPLLLEWAATVNVTAELLAEIDTYQTPADAFPHPYKMRDLLQYLIRRSCFPTYTRNGYLTNDMVARYPEGAQRYAHIQDVLFPAFREKHPQEFTGSTEPY